MESKSTRDAYGDALLEMGDHSGVIVLDADLSVSTKTNKFAGKYPSRFINVGCAEQNLMGVAAGLALSGKKVFVYSIIPFLTMRAFEQIRNDICYHNLDITLLGVGSGLSYGVLGATHFALEDIAILRSLPNMTIFNPADAIEGVAVVEKIGRMKTPTYLRIGKKDEPNVFGEKYSHNIEGGVLLNKGHDICFFTTGTLLKNVIDAAEVLKEKHEINSTVIHFPTIKPIDKNIIVTNAKNKKLIVVVDEHYIVGGLYSVICENLGAIGTNAPVINCSVPQEFVKIVGSQEYLRKHFGLDTPGIVKKVLEFL